MREGEKHLQLSSRRWRFITKEASESPTGFVRRPPPPAAKTDEAQKGGAEIPETTKPEDP